MAEISLISATTVAPMNPRGRASSTRMELTPWELQFLPHGPIQKGLLFPKPLHELQNTIIHHLTTSLSRTLDFFYPLAGRLSATFNHHDNTTCFFISCNAAGVPFTHAVADGVTVGDILDPVNVPGIVSSFFPPYETPNYRRVSKPLLAVQVTDLADGIFIGCTMNHVISDGTSFWHFFNSWSEISRCGSDKMILPSPVFDRWFLPDHVHLPLLIRLSSLVFGGLPSSPTQERVFHFKKENIAALKAKANLETGTDRISSLQALLAHFWRCVTRNRRLPENQETTYMLLIDMRARVDPPFPQQYFGGAVQAGNMTMKVGELLGLGLGHAAWKMNQMISTFTGEVATNFWESWAKNPRPVVASDVIISNALMASSSPRFKVYGNDFGWGRPVAVRSGGGNKCDGKTTIFEGAEEGSVDIQACLLPQTMEAMMEDAEFMDALTI